MGGRFGKYGDLKRIRALKKGRKENIRLHRTAPPAPRRRKGRHRKPLISAFSDDPVVSEATAKHAPVPRTASFRFYEELNDFLPEKKRKKSFPQEFVGTPSVKDIIEGMGVPHTEIDVILVDGRSVGFDYRMTGGERVSVYPVFESFDIAPVVRLRSEPLRDPRFVVDAHLGKLAGKLRLLGFDTLFRNDFDDSEIIRLSLEENRIILTRDRGVLKHKTVSRGYFVRSESIDAQLQEVVRRFQLENSFQPFTRCSGCNGLLHPVEKEAVRDRLPERSRDLFEDFMECDGCGKIYWQGSHRDKILKFIDTLKR